MPTLPRHYSIEVPWPPNSGPVKLTFRGITIREFPYSVTDSAVIDWAIRHNRGEVN